MNLDQWQSSDHPRAMIAYLENAGCYMEFAPFFTHCFDRIRHEFHHPAIENAIYGHGEVDELCSDANQAIEEMLETLATLEVESEEWVALNREVMYSRSVLMREFHDFGEAIRNLSEYLIEIADSPDEESVAQVQFLREQFKFPFTSSSDEDF